MEVGGGPGCRGGGSAGSGGGGTLVAPVTGRVSSRSPHAPSCERRAGVRPSRPLFRHQPLGIRRAWRPPLAAARVARLFARGARSGSGVLEPAAVFTGARGQAPIPAGIRRLRPGVLPRPPASASICRAAFGAGLGTSAQRSVAPEPSGLGPFSFGKKQKVLRPGGQPPVWALLWGKHCGANLGPGAVFLLLVVGPSLEITGLDPPLKIAATSVPLSFVRIVF